MLGMRQIRLKARTSLADHLLPKTKQNEIDKLVIWTAHVCAGCRVHF